MVYIFFVCDLFLLMLINKNATVHFYFTSAQGL